jgi:hypothetical protein
LFARVPRLLPPSVKKTPVMIIALRIWRRSRSRTRVVERLWIGPALLALIIGTGLERWLRARKLLAEAVAARASGETIAAEFSQKDARSGGRRAGPAA